MLSIPDPAYQLEVAKDIAHQQILSIKIIGIKHKTMASFLKKDWKTVGMGKETITDLIRCIQTIIMVLKKNSSNRLKTLSDIEKNWR